MFPRACPGTPGTPVSYFILISGYLRFQQTIFKGMLKREPEVKDNIQPCWLLLPKTDSG